MVTERGVGVRFVERRLGCPVPCGHGGSPIRRNEEPVAAHLRPLAQITCSSTQRDNQYDTG